MKNIKFVLKSIGPVIVLIGRRDTGKVFGKRLLYYHQDIPIGTVISGTEAGNGYSSMVPKLFIHDEYNTADENILKRQKMVIKQIKKKKMHMEK